MATGVLRRYIQNTRALSIPQIPGPSNTRVLTRFAFDIGFIGKTAALQPLVIPSRKLFTALPPKTVNNRGFAVVPAALVPRHLPGTQFPALSRNRSRRRGGVKGRGTVLPAPLPHLFP